MKKEDPWFFAERAEAFAKLVLTKHHAVRFSTDGDWAIDLMVEIRTDGHLARRRLFGVQLVGYMDLPTVQDAETRILSQQGSNSVVDALPLCVFVIGVRKPEGIYRWLVEPVVGDGQALLQRPAEPHWHILDEAGTAHLIDQVNSWYDAFFEGSTPKTRDRHSKVES